MKSYYRTSEGHVDGPFTDSQLWQMWRTGELSINDQVCLAGTEEWLACPSVIEDMKAGWRAEEAQQQIQSLAPKKTAPEKNRTRTVCLVIAWSAGLLFIALLAAWFLGKHGH